MFSFVAVIERARSDAANTAAFATSSSDAARPSMVAASSPATMRSRPSKPCGSVSAIPLVWIVSARMP